MRTAKVIYCLGFVWILGCAMPVSAQSSERLADRKISITMREQPPGEVFDFLIHNLGIPIGLEKSTLDSHHNDFAFQTVLSSVFTPANEEVGPETYDRERVARSNRGRAGRVYETVKYCLTVNFKEAPVKDVFDTIVKQMSNYDWEISDEVINIFPKKGRDPRLEKLLELEVDEYELKPASPLWFIRYSIRTHPQVVSFLKESDLTLSPWQSGGRSLNFLSPNGVQGRKLTVKQVLNRLAKMKQGGWILRLDKQADHPEQNFIEIDI